MDVVLQLRREFKYSFHIALTIVWTSAFSTPLTSLKRQISSLCCSVQVVVMCCVVPGGITSILG